MSSGTLGSMMSSYRGENRSINKYVETPHRTVNLNVNMSRSQSQEKYYIMRVKDKQCDIIRQ